MRKNPQVVSGRPQYVSEFNPLDLIQMAGPNPSFSFSWESPKSSSPSDKKKRRMISRPNADMRRLHSVYKKHLENAITAMGKEGTYGLRFLPSATGCVTGSNPLINAKMHEDSEFFYVTDLRNAYPSVDLRRLAILLFYIEHYDYYEVDFSLRQFSQNELAQYEVSTNPSFQKMEGFVQIAFGGYGGQGLAVGGPLSPYLLNLYCEVFLDSALRYYFFKYENSGNPERKIIYTRYVDDLTFSSKEFISAEMRKDIRRIVENAGLTINHRKSLVLKRSMGTVFITKLGLRTENVPIKNSQKQTKKGTLTFSQKKRRRLHGILQSFIKPIQPKEGSQTKLPSYNNDSPEVVSGVIAEFLHYYKNVEKPTATDRKTIALCKQFEIAAEPYLGKLKEMRRRNQAMKNWKKKHS